MLDHYRPAIINHEQMNYLLRNKKFVLCLLYLMFVILSTFTAYLAVKVWNISIPLISDYYEKFFRVDRLFKFVLDGVIFTVIFHVFIKLISVLNKEINFKTYDDEK